MYKNEFEKNLHDLIRCGMFKLDCSNLNSVLRPQPQACIDVLLKTIPDCLKNL